MAGLFTNQTLLWFWGHEHRLIWYRLQKWTNSQTGDSFSFFGRCIGNGGFPCQNQGTDQVTFKKAYNKYKSVTQMIEYGPMSQSDSESNSLYGRNGYIKFKFKGRDLRVVYYLIQDNGDQKLTGASHQVIKFATEEFHFDDNKITNTFYKINDINEQNYSYNRNCKNVNNLNEVQTAFQRSTSQSSHLCKCTCLH